MQEKGEKNGECKLVEFFIYLIIFYEVLWEMNIEENNNLSFVMQFKFVMVYVENIKIIFYYLKEDIILMVLYKW